MQILLVKTSSLGDVVHNFPVVTDLAARFPGAAIDWVVEEGFADLPSLHPAVRRVIPVAWRRWRRHLLRPGTWREIDSFLLQLKAKPYDLVLDTQGLLKSALIAALARRAPAGRIVGYCREAAREALAARFYDESFTIPRNVHAVERNRWLAAAAGGYSAEAPLRYGIVAPSLGASWLPTGPYAVLLTATSRTDKLWPDDAWLTLGTALSDLGLTCLLPGGNPAERERAGELAKRIPGGIAVPPVGLREAAGLLAGAKLVVGVDTGLVHLATALGRPTLAVFCGSDPSLTGVLGKDNAVNIGASGAPPAAAEVVDAARCLLS